MSMQISYYGNVEENGALVDFIDSEVVLSGVDSAQSAENPVNAGYALVSASSTMRFRYGDDPTALPTDQYILTGTTRILKTRAGHSFSVRADNALSALTLTPSEILDSASNDDLVGTLTGMTPGSTLSLTDTGAGQYALDGNTIIVADDTLLVTDTITVRETLGGAAGTPRDTIITITVNPA